MSKQSDIEHAKLLAELGLGHIPKEDFGMKIGDHKFIIAVMRDRDEAVVNELTEAAIEVIRQELRPIKEQLFYENGKSKIDYLLEQECKNARYRSWFWTITRNGITLGIAILLSFFLVTKWHSTVEQRDLAETELKINQAMEKSRSENHQELQDAIKSIVDKINKK